DALDRASGLGALLPGVRGRERGERRADRGGIGLRAELELRVGRVETVATQPRDALARVFRRGEARALQQQVPLAVEQLEIEAAVVLPVLLELRQRRARAFDRSRARRRHRDEGTQADRGAQLREQRRRDRTRLLRAALQQFLDFGRLRDQRVVLGAQ